MIAFAAMLAAYILSQFFRAFLAVIAVDLNRDLGLGPAELGNLSAIWFLVFALAQLPVGIALDRFGPRRTMTVLLAPMALGAVLFSQGQSYAQVLVGMGLIGLGCSPALMGSLFVVARTLPPEQFAMRGSLMIGIGSLGNLAAAAPFSRAVAAFGWRSSMMAMAALAALSVVLLAFVLRDPPRVQRPQDGGSGWHDFKAILGAKALWPMVPLIAISYALVGAERSLWVGPYFAQIHGLDALQVGNATFAMALAMSLGAFLYGPTERFLRSPKKTTILGTLLTGAAFIWLGLSPKAGVPLAIGLMSGIGFFGITYAILLAHGRRFFADHLVGRGVTYLNFLFMAGVGVAQNLSGQFVAWEQRSGVPPVETFASLHLGFGLILLAALVVYFFAPEAPQEKAG